MTRTASLIAAALVALLILVPGAARAVVPGDACTSEGSEIQEDPPDGNVHLICNGSVWVLWRTIDRVSATNGLVGWWKLDESAGTSAADSSGNGNTGTLSGGAVWEPSGGKLGGDLALNGIDGAVTVPETASINITRPITISAWIKRTVPMADTEQNAIVFKAVSGNYRYYFFYTYDAGYGYGMGYKLAFIPGSGGNVNSAWIPYFTPTGQWQHVAVSFDAATNLVSLYFNGVLIGTTIDPVSGGYPAGTGPLSLGVRADSSSRYLNGDIDDVRIYNRVLSANEVAALYGEFVITHHERLGSSKGIQVGQDYVCDTASEGTVRYAQGEGPSSGLVGWWKLDETAGTSASDSSGSGLSGTLTNGPVWQPSGGKVGGALLFDNTNKYVSVADNAILDFDGAEPFSISAWFKHNDPANANYDNIVSKGIAGTCLYNYGLHFDSNTQILIFATNDDNTCTNMVTQSWAFSSTSIQPGVWYYAVGTFDGTNMRLYVNGILEDTQNISTHLPLSRGTPLYMGIGQPSGPGQFWNGLIDDVRIYSRALSMNEINQLYKLGLNKMSWCDGTDWQAWP